MIRLRIISGVLFLLVLNLTLVFSQKRTLYDYFPHHVGDVWEYVNYEGNISSRYKIFITRIDTSYSDTAKYIYYNNSMTPTRKIKLYDSSVVYMKYLNNWIPFMKFSDSLKSYWQWNSFTYCLLDTTTQVNYLSYNTTEIIFYTYHYEPKYYHDGAAEKYIFLKGIGNYSREYDVGLTTLYGCIINGRQYGYPVAIEQNNNKTIVKNNLQNFPNPFNSATRISYDVSSYSFISLKVYDLLGREMAIIDEGYKEAGSYTKFWNPKNISSGTYIIVFHSSNSLLSRKMIYLK
jgi:hypothetical protein